MKSFGQDTLVPIFMATLKRHIKQAKRLNMNPVELVIEIGGPEQTQNLYILGLMLSKKSLLRGHANLRGRCINMGNSIIRYDQEIDPREILFIDAERTYPEGNDGRRRIMELAIIDGTGASVYHGYFNPGIEVEHKFARKGLVDEVLTFAPNFDSEWLCIKQLLKCKHVVAWWMDMKK